MNTVNQKMTIYLISISDKKKILFTVIYSIIEKNNVKIYIIFSKTGLYSGGVFN